MLNKYFNKIVCINLVERNDKLIHVNNQFKFANIKSYFYTTCIFPYNKYISLALTNVGKGNLNFLNHPNEFGCAQSHYNIIKTAYLSGVEKLFIFEDDICFIKSYNEIIEEYLNNLPKDWDIISLAGFTTYPKYIKEQTNDYWFKGNKLWYACSYGMNRKAMKMYIDMQDSYLTQADMPLYKLQNNPEINFYFTNTPLIVQSKYLNSDLREIKNYEETINYYEQKVYYDNYLNYFGIESILNILK